MVESGIFNVLTNFNHQHSLKFKPVNSLILRHETPSKLNVVFHSSH